MKNFEKLNPALLGLLQAFGVVVYCTLVGVFFNVGSRILPDGPDGPNILFIALMLSLFVFSAAVTGTLVFGYPSYLAFRGKHKEALVLVGYTLLFGTGLILALIVLVFSLRY